MDNKNEIMAVKALGYVIGYGNMMSIASKLWEEMLLEKGNPISGAFIPALRSDIIEEERGSYPGIKF